jgi:electron transport complex protein RnfE
MILTVVPDYHGFLLAILPPGAFIGLGALIATRNWLEQRKLARAQALPSAALATH